MTDEQKPGTEPAAIGDDETTRTPVTPPARPRRATVPPMRRMAGRIDHPASPDPGQPPRRPHAAHRPRERRRRPSRLRSSRVAPPPAVAAAVAPLGGRPRGRRSSSSARRRPSPRSSPAASAGSTVLGYAPANTIDVHGGPPRPARRSAPGRRRVPLEVPGLRRPGRARHQARRGPRRSRPRRDRRPSRPTPATSSRGSTASSRSASGRCRPPRPVNGSGQVDRRLPCPGPALDQGPGRRAGVARRRADQGRRDLDHRGLPGRHDPPVPGVPGHPAAYAIVDGKVVVDRRRVLGQGRDRHQRLRRLRRRARARRPRSVRSAAITSASRTSALRPLLAWSEQLSESMGAGAGAATRRRSPRPCSRRSRSGPPTGCSSRTTPSSWRRPSRSRRRRSARPRTGRPRSPSTSRRRRSSRRPPTTWART